jgi:hypothetical protein
MLHWSMPYADQDAQRAYQREWLARRRQEWIKSNGPCVDCGSWEDPEVDHANASDKVTHRVWSWSKARRDAELAKCVVRCGPCHEKKTVDRGERSHGESHGATHITAADVLAIRASTEPERVLARRYGVSNSTAHRIRTGETWKYMVL